MNSHRSPCKNLDETRRESARSSRPASLVGVAAVLLALGCQKQVAPQGPIASGVPHSQNRAATQDLPKAQGGEPGSRESSVATLARVEAPSFAHRRVRAKVKRIARNVTGAVWSSATDVIFYVGSTSVVHRGRQVVRIREQGYDAVLSPKGDYVAIAGESEVAMVRVANGEVVGRRRHDSRAKASPERRLVRFVSERVARVFDGCQLWRLTVGGGSERQGAQRCGRPSASADGSRLFVRQSDEVGDSGAFSVAELAPGGAYRSVVEGRGDPPGFSAFALGRGGRYMCLANRRRRQDLRCVDTDSQQSIQVWNEPTDGRLAINGRGQLAFAVGKLRTTRDLYLADLGAGTVARVGQLNKQDRWLQFSGDRFLWVSGGSRVDRYDLVDHVRTTITLPRGEWEGLAVSPDGQDQVYLGKERGSRRDLYRVTWE